MANTDELVVTKCSYCSMKMYQLDITHMRIKKNLETNIGFICLDCFSIITIEHLPF